MPQILNKPENYIRHRIQTYGNNAVLLIYTDDDPRPEKEVIGDAFGNYEVTIEEDRILVEEVA